MNKDQYYQAVLARDARFDGVFFSAVKTTGIYCRPICPAKPLKQNIEFFLSAAQAEAAGYRPCLRCRPESAPLSPAWMGKSSLVQRALKHIDAEGFFESNEDQFADKFGVSPRHLRRLFETEIGKTPKQIAFEKRLNFAKKLIFETDLSMTEIALTSGFNSVRRFNDAFTKRFNCEPRSLRKVGHESTKTSRANYSFGLSYRTPFDWQHALNHFRLHLIGGVEIVTDSSYERCFRIEGKVGSVCVSHDEAKNQLRAEIWCEDPSLLFGILQKIRMMFDLDSNPNLIEDCFKKNRALSSLLKKSPGLRVVSAWDPFESAICTILGQLVSLEQARNLVNQLVINYGETIVNPVNRQSSFLFPTAKTLASCDLGKLRTTEARRNSIRKLSELVCTGKINFSIPQEPLEIKKALLEINGIGEWSAEYISLRALRNVDAFPKTDLILKRALELHPDLHAETLSPWRGYLAIYLWNEYAAKLSKANKPKSIRDEVAQKTKRLEE